MGQDQVSGGVSVLCWLAAPVAMFYGNLQNSVIRSKSVLKSSSVIKKSSPFVVTGSSVFDISIKISLDGRLYFLTFSTKRCSDLPMISCYGTPALSRAVTHVRFPEWFEKYLGIPDIAHIFFIKDDNLLTPIGWILNLNSPFYPLISMELLISALI